MFFLKASRKTMGTWQSVVRIHCCAPEDTTEPDDEHSSPDTRVVDAARETAVVAHPWRSLSTVSQATTVPVPAVVQGP